MAKLLRTSTIVIVAAVGLVVTWRAEDGGTWGTGLPGVGEGVLTSARGSTPNFAESGSAAVCCQNEITDHTKQTCYCTMSSTGLICYACTGTSVLSGLAFEGVNDGVEPTGYFADCSYLTLTKGTCSGGTCLNPVNVGKCPSAYPEIEYQT